MSKTDSNSVFDTSEVLAALQNVKDSKPEAFIDMVNDLITNEA